MAITNTVSAFVQSQVPDFIRDDPNSGFVAFLKGYYSWMEQTQGFDVINQGKQLPSYWDVDQTTDAFIQYFINDFLPHFPNDVALDERKLIKAARQFYQKKGSADSIRFLFRVLYNKEADIYFPKQNILKASDGKWYQPKILRIQVDPALTANNFDYQQLVGRQGLGSISNVSCVIESASEVVDPSLGVATIELFISGVNQNFNNQDKLNVIYGFDANGAPLVFSERIISSIDEVVIVPNHGGLKYQGTTDVYPGDPITFIGGLASGDPNAQKAVGYVNSTSLGAVTGVIVNDGSFYYRIGANTVVTVVNAPGDLRGANANLQVDAVDAANSLFLLINSDAVHDKQNTALNVANYAFANFALSNINTVLGTAFTYANLQFANITDITVLAGGSNYATPPSIKLQVVYNTDYVNELASNLDTLGVRSNVQPIDDLGFMAGVRIGAAGTGYSNVTDKIVVPSSIGYGAVFDFVTSPAGAGGNNITQVLITNRGQGYIQLPTQLLIANSANVANGPAGTGAVLTAYGFGQGASLTTAVNEIGIIQDFRLGSRGFDYVATPRVSMRNEDLTLLDLSGNLAFITGQAIFQGVNANSGTYSAYVDSYNVSSRVLRVYDYQGNLNTAQNLVYLTSNVHINTAAATPVTIYGNGQANANVIFIPGLINLPGFFYNTDGFLSADKYLQDSNTYHNYSYKIVVEQALNDYKKTLLDLVHPSGMSMIGEFQVVASNISSQRVSLNVGVLPFVLGNISSNAFDVNANLVGIGTSFTSNANVGDLVVFNTIDATRKLQVKEIKSITNATFLKLFSNTSWIWGTGNVGGSVTVNTGSNVVYSTGLQGNVAVNDIIRLNVSGNTQTSIVQVVVNANALTVNTVYNANATNLIMLVFPSLNTANYSIIQQPV